MKIVVGMATFRGRERCVQEAIDSLVNQVDEIVLYDNESNPDLTDNGKFYGLNILEEDCYYLSCDDDLIYPADYANRMVEAIERKGGIVSHHGRILLGQNRSYYTGHKTFHCLKYNNSEARIDVAGTGVSGWKTSEFNPKHLAFAKDKRMSDIIFSLEAARQRVPIHVLRHRGGYIKHSDKLDMAKTIAAEDSLKQDRHIQLADEIWRLNYQREQKT